MALSLSAQEPTQPQDTTARNRQQPVPLAPVTVTATRTEKDVFLTPSSVSIFDRTDLLELKPNTAADLFVRLPGLDITGVGANQTRPSIRGQRGQRILLLQDGMRLNNARRQQDFGEIPGLIDVNTIERVEIVRGPASVLYGTDAIGGVVNLMTRRPRDEGVHGSFGYRFSDYDGQHRAVGFANGRSGNLSFLLGGTYRNADDFKAPAGSYGDIVLSDTTRVLNTGAKDYSIEAYAAYDMGGRHEVFGRYQRYDADSSGFGLVEPDAYAPGAPRIEILYPFQTFDKFTLGYRGRRLNTPVADRVSFVGYYQDNDRQLNNNITGISLGAPGSELRVFSENVTDINTVGGRLEASKLAWGSVMWTYGVDLFHDDSKNADTSQTIVIGFGPPMVSVNTTPTIPNATYQSIGAFAQADWQVTNRASLILGARWQSVRAQTKETPGLSEPLISETDRTVVAALNALYSVTRNVTLIGTVGRAFRSPNLVERFFAGATPEGGGFQVRNPNLEPETSLNFDLGLRYQEARLPFGFMVGANYTHFDTKDVNDPENPVGDTYDDKIAARLRYTHPSNRLFAEYEFRWNGERKDVFTVATPPVGPVLPAFTTHSLRAGWTFFQRGMHQQRIGIALTNFTNELYAEFANAAFFRPQPRRGLLITWDMTF
jgi:hemoglobin/transferrin/lactoferrin receptor protein